MTASSLSIPLCRPRVMADLPDGMRGPTHAPSPADLKPLLIIPCESCRLGTRQKQQPGEVPSSPQVTWYVCVILSAAVRTGVIDLGMGYLRALTVSVSGECLDTKILTNNFRFWAKTLKTPVRFRVRTCPDTLPVVALRATCLYAIHDMRLVFGAIECVVSVITITQSVSRRRAWLLITRVERSCALPLTVSSVETVLKTPREAPI